MVLMVDALFAFSANFVPTSSDRAEAFGFTFCGALSEVTKSALAPLRSVISESNVSYGSYGSRTVRTDGFGSGSGARIRTKGATM